MPKPLDVALAQVRGLLLDRDRLVRAVAAGHRRAARPAWQRAELRPVAVKAGERLQISLYDGQRPHTRNFTWDDAVREVDALLGEPYGNWHLQTTEQTVQVRVTKRGEAQVHREARAVSREVEHDRAKRHLLDPGDPLFQVLGANAAKRRQVDAFLRYLDLAVPAEPPGPEPPGPNVAAEPGGAGPLRIADLGCGNAYLTFAAYRYLTAVRGLEVSVTGIELRADQRERNTALAAELGCAAQVRFVES
ncbi:MAG: methyltransferase, partial [Micromonosporaceae bacterium]